MSKKSLYLKTTILLLPILVSWILIYFVPMLSMGADYPMWILQREYLTESSEYNSVLFLGDSSVKWNIDMSGLPDDTYMAALGSGSAIEAYYSLALYLQNHPTPDHVILSLTPGTYYKDRSESFLVRDIAFHYLSEEEVTDFLNVLEEYPENEISKTIDKENILKYYYRTPDIFVKQLVKNIFKGAYAKDIAIYETVKAERGSYSYMAEEESKEEENDAAKDGEFSIDPVIMYYIERLAALCDENEIGLTVVQAPMSDTNYNALTDEWWTEFKEGMQRLADVCDVDMEIPVYDVKYFESSNHLTADGVPIFTNDFYEKWQNLWTD